MMIIMMMMMMMMMMIMMMMMMMINDDHSDDDYNCYCMLRVPVNEICSSQMNPFLIVHFKSLKSPHVP